MRWAALKLGFKRGFSEPSDMDKYAAYAGIAMGVAVVLALFAR